ncbi:beta-ketoacyl-[acyl-carrier-protein] synthase family protein [Mesonia maritima]|uniref:3-oxoacyl-[acyl-carrier-protein] synthase-1 n=1 Tax=Mesonia maritima TaxID=1793873 RepID=A0ABU1K7S4_9FLAO|nr:beta-ketoacyl-[acyl-carrier-protein] synthase family protein [Mesonia maritima]MDR6301669.1 3-oxoacyl-[acyl-carrier-protein] synthase-1 [Mesonia maritima]
MQNRVAITGIGAISAIGNSAEENFNSLRQGNSGIGKLHQLQTRHKDHFPCGEIKKSNETLADLLHISSDKVFTRAALLACIAAKEALQQADINLPDNKLAFVNGTSVGGMDFTEKFYSSFSEKKTATKYIEAQHPGFTTDSIAEYLKIHKLATTISTACSSGANAILTGAKIIQNKTANYVLVGGTDCLSKFTLNGFNSLKILSEELCKPFDEHRNGLNLGEAAAYLVLESENQAKKQNKKILAYVSGFGNANDAHHQTASSETGEGSFLAMKKALESANLAPDKIDYINAHGTATLNNDLSEGIALKRIFNNIPALSSTKSFTGHTLAAAGALEAVFSVLALQNQCVFPNLNFKTPIESLNFSPESQFYSKEINHVLSNSFGFGGNCSSLVFSKAV